MFPFNILSANPKPAGAQYNQLAAAKAIAADPESEIESVIRDAQTARKTGDLAAAGKMLSQLVLVAPDNARVLAEYGKTLAMEGRSDDALAFLERAIELQPGDWTVFSAQGIAYDRKGKYQAAQASYQRALALKPGEPTVLNNDALSHMQAGDLAGAEELLREVSPLAPDYSHIAQSLALVQSLKAAQPVEPVAADVSRQPQSVETKFASVDSPVVSATGPIQTLTAPARPVALVAAESDAANIPKALAQPATQPPVSEPTVLASLPVASSPILEDRFSAIEALRADPTVVMAPIPKDDLAAGHTQVRASKGEEAAAPQKARVETIAKQTPADPQQGPKKYVYVQAGSYLSELRANQATSGLDSLGARVMPGVVNGRAVYRVRIGPFLTREQAKDAFGQAQALGRSDLIIVTE